MSDFQSLFLIVCALYLLECVLWLRGGVVVFRRSLLGPWRVLRRGWELAAFDIQGILAPLLPPFSRVLVCEYPRLRISPYGFSLDRSERAGRQNLLPERHFLFASISAIHCNGTKVTCDGQVVVRYSSSLAARHWAALLTRLKQSSEIERASLVEDEFRRLFDSNRLRETLSACHDAGRALRWACSAEFALLLIVFPILGHLFGFRMIWLPLLICLLLSGGYIAWQFCRAHRAVYGMNDPDRGSTAAMLFLSPVSATRALDELEKHALGAFHPLAATAVLCPPQLFEAEASRTLRELLFPPPFTVPEKSHENTAAEAWFHEHWQKAVEQFINLHFADPARLLTPPPKESDECRSYCPRCCGQYVFESGKCAECELPVVSFSQPTKTPAVSVNAKQVPAE